MTTAEIIFIGLIVAMLLIWVAWTFAPRNNRTMRFWIELTGRRTARTPPIKPDNDDDAR